MSNDTRVRQFLHRWGRPVAWGLSGVVAGGVLVGTLTAQAASTPSPSPSSSAASEANEGHGRGPRGGHGPRTPASVADAAKVKAAVLAKYAGATVDGVAVEGNGFEAHVRTKAGLKLRVLLDKAFAVTAAEQGCAGRDGRGGPGDAARAGGHSNMDPAHEAAESPERAAQEKADDAAHPSASPSPTG